MKVFKDNKEVKDATVIFDTTGRPALVRIKDVNYLAEAFTFKEDKQVEKQSTTKNNKTVDKSKSKA